MHTVPLTTVKLARDITAGDKIRHRSGILTVTRTASNCDYSIAVYGFTTRNPEHVLLFRSLDRSTTLDVLA